MLERIEVESFGLFCPGPTDELVGCEAFEGFEPLGEVVGGDEIGEMVTQLVVALVVEALDGRVFDRAVHALDLPIGPRVPGLGKAVIDVVASAGRDEGMGPEGFLSLDLLLDIGCGPTLIAWVGEVDAV